MNIGSIFIALGFKVQGKRGLDDTDVTLERTTRTAVKLTLGINAINAAFLILMETSARAGQVLRNFAIGTGYSTDALQEWRHTAVVNGVAADDLTASILTLQKAQSDFALGQGQNLGAWSILGVDPRQNPFEVIKQLRASVSSFKDVGVARNLLGQVGLEGLLPLLRASNAEFEKWSKNFIVNERQIDQLSKLNAGWQSLKMSVSLVKTQLAAAFAPALLAVARGLEWVAELMAKFTQWLSRGSAAASAVKFVLSAVAILMLALGAILAVVTAAISALVGIIGLLNLTAMAGPLGVIVLYLTAIAAVVAGLVLLLNDMWVSISGGDGQLAAIGRWLTTFDAIRASIEGIWKAWDRFMDALKTGQKGFEWLFDKLPNWALGVGKSAEPGSKTTNQNVQVNIDGAKDPRATGREVTRSLEHYHRATADQAPVYNW